MRVMDKRMIEENVMKIVGGHLGIPPFRLTLQTHLMNDLGADSLDVRELIITIEERFGIKIPNKSLSHIKRIGDIAEVVSKHKHFNKNGGIEHGKRPKIEK